MNGPDVTSRIFDPAKASRLEDPERLSYLPFAAVFAMLDAPPGGIVVDYGAGTGFFACALAHERPDLTIVAFDRQPQMLELLRAKPDFAALGERIRLVGPAEVHAYAGRANRVLCVNVLHELDDEHIAHICSLFEPGGECLAIDWNAAVERDVGPHGPHIFNPSRAQTYLTERGCRILETQTFRYQFAVRFTAVD